MKLYIDPGHGGEDSGAIGPTGFEEKDFNQKVAKLLNLACRWSGWHTLMSTTVVEMDRSIISGTKSFWT